MAGQDDTYVPMDKLAKAYVKMREAIANIQKEYDAQIEALKSQQEIVRQALQEEMKKLGVTSMRTTEGTIIMSMKTRYFTNDWDAMKTFILANGVVELLERRIAQKAMAEWLKEYPTKVPPGLSSESSYEVSVRKA
jgi:hypothetical protein